MTDTNPETTLSKDDLEELEHNMKSFNINDPRPDYDMGWLQGFVEQLIIRVRELENAKG